MLELIIALYLNCILKCKGNFGNILKKINIICFETKTYYYLVEDS